MKDDQWFCFFRFDQKTKARALGWDCLKDGIESVLDTGPPKKCSVSKGYQLWCGKKLVRPKLLLDTFETA